MIRGSREEVGERLEGERAAIAPARPNLREGEVGALLRAPVDEPASAPPASHASFATTEARATRTLRGALLLGSARVAVVSLLAWGLLFNFSEVRGSSMTPGIRDHDHILVDHFSYLLGGVELGDVVVLRYPLDPDIDYIKRVVGLPGDELVLEDGGLWRNGERLPEPYLDAAALDPYTRMRVVVEPDHYFVLGDNRLRSSDSREFGQVPRHFLRGKARLRVWPPARAGLIE